MEIQEFVEKLEAWHSNKVSQLHQIIDNDDCSIKIGDMTIESGTDLAKGLRAGVLVSLEFLGKLPFNVSKSGE